MTTPSVEATPFFYPGVSASGIFYRIFLGLRKKSVIFAGFVKVIKNCLIKMVPTQGKKKMIRLLFVSLGNICRSPAAEGIMKSIVEKNDLQDVIEVDSAGTSGWHEGDLPDERMRAHGEKRKYDFCSRSRKFTKSDFDDFDYIIVMDENNYNRVKSMSSNPEQAGKIHLMTDFALQYGYYNYIPDPYYGGSSDFELVLDLLEDACEGLLQTIKKDHSLI